MTMLLVVLVVLVLLLMALWTYRTTHTDLGPIDRWQSAERQRMLHKEKSDE